MGGSDLENGQTQPSVIFPSVWEALHYSPRFHQASIQVADFSSKKTTDDWRRHWLGVSFTPSFFFYADTA